MQVMQVRELLRMDFSRMLHGAAFRLTLALCAALGVWDLVLNVQAHYESLEILKTQTIAYSYPYSVYNACIAADGVYLPSVLLYALFPLLAALPFGASAARDIKTGYFKNLAVRKPWRSIILSRSITVFAGALLAVLFAAFGQMVFSMMFLPALKPEIASYSFPLMMVGHLGHSFYAVHPFWYLLLYDLYDAFYLAALAVLTVPVGLLTGNALTALAAPAVTYYLASFLLENLNLAQWMPSCILPPYSDIYLRLPIMLAELALLLAAAALLAALCAGRKTDVF